MSSVIYTPAKNGNVQAAISQSMSNQLKEQKKDDDLYFYEQLMRHDSYRKVKGRIRQQRRGY